MKAAVSLRLTNSRQDFRVFFPYSDAAVRAALLAAGVRYEATARSYLLVATPEAVAPVRAACAALGVGLLVPVVPALAAALPPPTPHEALLARYCQLIALKRYSPNTLKNYRLAFNLFLTHHAPRLPLDLSKEEVLDYLAGRVAGGISETYQNLLVNAIKFYYEQVEGQPRQYYAIPRPKRPL